MNNIEALIETFGLASMEASDDKPTLKEVTELEHSKNILAGFGNQLCTITQDDIDKAWNYYRIDMEKCKCTRCRNIHPYCARTEKLRSDGFGHDLVCPRCGGKSYYKVED